jgi:hypothetical protein
LSPDFLHPFSEPPLEEITELLARMGDTAEQVAQTLRSAGVRGLRGNTSFLNPIVRYLNWSIEIGGRLEVVEGTALRLQLSGEVREAPLPPAVQAFLTAFHRGDFPHLEGTRG